MKTHHNTPQSLGYRASHARKISAVPPADGVQAIDLEVFSQEAMRLGVDLAASWLDSTKSEPLHLYMARLSHETPPKYWPDLQAGFLARIDQRLRSDLGGQHRSAAHKAAMVVLGNSTMNRMLEQLRKTVALIETGDIEPTTAQGAQRVLELMALVEGITLLGGVRK